MRGNGQVTHSFGLICLKKICSRVFWEIFLAIERTTDRVVSLKLTQTRTPVAPIVANTSILKLRHPPSDQVLFCGWQKPEMERAQALTNCVPPQHTPGYTLPPAAKHSLAIQSSLRIPFLFVCSF